MRLRKSTRPGCDYGGQEARTGSSDLSREVSSGPAGAARRWRGFQDHAQSIPLAPGKHAPGSSSELMTLGSPSGDRQIDGTVSFISHHEGGWQWPFSHTRTLFKYLEVRWGEDMWSQCSFMRDWAERKKSHLRRVFFFNWPNLDTTYTNTSRKDDLGTGLGTVGREWGQHNDDSQILNGWVTAHKFLLSELTNK